MTAPRMTDEQLAYLEGLPFSLAGLKIADEARRARSSEAALLARVERLEGALRKYVDDDECKHGMDGTCDPNEPPCRYCAGGAALSEKP